MFKANKSPAALAGADRAEVTKLPGKNDYDNITAAAIDLQVRRVLSRYAVSLSLAAVIAEIVYGRTAP